LTLLILVWLWIVWKVLLNDCALCSMDPLDAQTNWNVDNYFNNIHQKNKMQPLSKHNDFLHIEMD
jgi:hypothetical protein